MGQTVQYREILRQHRLVKAGIKRLEAAVGAGGGTAEAEERAAFAGEIVRLKTILEDHFSFEEEGGYLPLVLASRPTLSRQVGLLREQHTEILARLESFGERFARQLPIEEARSALLEILRLVAQHEIEETDLIQKTVVEEMGAGD